MVILLIKWVFDFPLECYYLCLFYWYLCYWYYYYDVSASSHKSWYRLSVWAFCFVGDHLVFASSLNSGGHSVSSTSQTSSLRQHDSYLPIDQYLSHSSAASTTSNSSTRTYGIPTGTVHQASSSNISDTQRTDIFLMETAETNRNCAQTVDKSMVIIFLLFHYSFHQVLCDNRFWKNVAFTSQWMKD